MGKFKGYTIGSHFYSKEPGPGKPYKCHVLAIVEEMVVYRWYGRHKQWWHYGIKHPEILDIYRVEEEK